MNIIFAILFAPMWQASGMAIAVLLSETFVTVTMMLYLSLNNFNILGRISMTDNPPYNKLK